MHLQNRSSRTRLSSTALGSSSLRSGRKKTWGQLWVCRWHGHLHCSSVSLASGSLCSPCSVEEWLLYVWEVRDLKDTPSFLPPFTDHYMQFCRSFFNLDETVLVSPRIKGSWHYGQRLFHDEHRLFSLPIHYEHGLFSLRTQTLLTTNDYFSMALNSLASAHGVFPNKWPLDRFPSMSLGRLVTSLLSIPSLGSHTRGSHISCSSVMWDLVKIWWFWKQSSQFPFSFNGYSPISSENLNSITNSSCDPYSIILLNILQEKDNNLRFLLCGLHTIGSDRRWKRFSKGSAR